MQSILRIRKIDITALCGVPNLPQRAGEKVARRFIPSFGVAQALVHARRENIYCGKRMAILSRIRQPRAESENMSQARLARQTEVGRQTLNAIERGQRMPSLEVAHRIADALDCSLDYVFRYESEFPPIEDDPDDRVMRVTVHLDDDLEWWKSEGVSRVTTRA